MYLANDNIDDNYAEDIIRLSLSSFNLMIYSILLPLTLVKIKFNLFFQISFVYIAYAICLSSRFANDVINLIHHSVTDNDYIHNMAEIFVQIDGITSAIKLFMIFFFILQVSEVRAKI